MQDTWAEFLKIVQKEVGNQVVETWFKSVSLERWNADNKTVILRVPNQFVSSWIRQHYQSLLQKNLGRLLNSENVTLVFESPTCSQSNAGILPNSTPSRQIIPATHLPASNDETVHTVSAMYRPQNSLHNTANNTVNVALESQKRPKKKLSSIYDGYNFNSFVVGPSNHLAYSAAYAVAKGAGKEYNPLFIYGGTGLGKTHLMNCIVNEACRRCPNSRIVYKATDAFVDEFIRSIRLDRIHHFREKYRKVDLLLIDDIQFFSNKEQTQEAFFHIFNALHESGKQLVLSSDTPPSEISGLQDRLRSRLGWGLIADIQPPSLETKIAILIKKAAEHAIKLDNDVATAIASKIKSNIRELEGALTRLRTLSSLKNQPLSVDFVEQEFSIQGNGESLKIAPHEIIEAVSKHYTISSANLRSKKRDKKTALVRQILIFLIKKHTTCSLKTIGDYVGGRSHATVIHSISQAKRYIESDDAIARNIDTIEKNFLI